MGFSVLCLLTCFTAAVVVCPVRAVQYGDMYRGTIEKSLLSHVMLYCLFPLCPKSHSSRQYVLSFGYTLFSSTQMQAGNLHEGNKNVVIPNIFCVPVPSFCYMPNLNISGIEVNMIIIDFNFII